jgi:hypothetical protein
MRLAVPPVLLALLLAGCAASGGGPLPARGADGEPGFSPVHLAHDYASGAAETRSFVIPSTPARYDFAILAEGPQGGGACAGQMHVKVQRPDGSLEYDADFSLVSNQNPGCPCATPHASRGHALKAGTWTVTFTGQGIGAGVVEVTPSA